MIKADGVVIRRNDFSQTSQVVEFYTASHGRVATLAKGIRRKNWKFEGAVDLFYLCGIVYAPRGHDALAPLVECKVLDAMQGIAGAVEALYAAAYVVELVRAMTVPEEPNEELFAALLETLTGLAGRKDAALSVCRFELKALDAEGLAPDMVRCVSCGNRIGRGHTGRLSAEMSGYLCRRCTPGELQEAEPNAAQAAGLLRTFASTRWPTVDNLRVPAPVHVEIRRVMDSMLAYHFGRLPRSLGMFEAALGAAVADAPGGVPSLNESAERRSR